MTQVQPASEIKIPKAALLKHSAHLKGVGVHSGALVTVTIHPAPLGAGILFIRTDLGSTEIPARFDTVISTQNCTTIGLPPETKISTIEHLMAAFAATNIDDARVEIDGPEMPILDGSAAPFIDLVARAGVEETPSPRPVIRILKPITVTGDGGRKAELHPSEEPRIDIQFGFQGRVNFPDQSFSFKPLDNAFSTEVAPARTFGLLEDAEAIKAMGLAKGASLENTVVYDKDKIMNPEGLRFENECARHKALDALGDLHLAGGVIWGHYIGIHAGHGLNNQLLRALFANPAAFQREDPLL